MIPRPFENHHCSLIQNSNPSLLAECCIVTLTGGLTLATVSEVKSIKKGNVKEEAIFSLDDRLTKHFVPVFLSDTFEMFCSLSDDLRLKAGAGSQRKWGFNGRGNFMILWPVVRTTEDTNMRLGAHLRVYQFAKRFIQNIEANSLQVECLFMVMTHIGRDLQQEAPGQVCSTYQHKSSLLYVHYVGNGIYFSSILHFRV